MKLGKHGRSQNTMFPEPRVKFKDGSLSERQERDARALAICS